VPILGGLAGGALARWLDQEGMLPSPAATRAPEAG